MKYRTELARSRRHEAGADMARQAMTMSVTPGNGLFGTRGMSSCSPAWFGRSAEIVA